MATDDDARASEEPRAATADDSVEIELAHDEKLTQQHGFLHGGAIAAGLDNACGFASLSLMAAEAGMLTVEFKVNLLSPGRGERFSFAGRVVKPGRTLIFCEATAHALTAGGEKLIATAQATMMTLIGRDDVKG